MDRPATATKPTRLLWYSSETFNSTGKDAGSSENSEGWSTVASAMILSQIRSADETIRTPSDGFRVGILPSPSSTP